MLTVGQPIGAEGQQQHTDGELVAVGHGEVDRGDHGLDVGLGLLAGHLEAEHVRVRGHADLGAGSKPCEVGAVTRAVHGFGGRADIGGEVGAGDQALTELVGRGDARIDDGDAHAPAGEALAMERGTQDWLHGDSGVGGVRHDDGPFGIRRRNGGCAQVGEVRTLGHMVLRTSSPHSG